MSYWFYDKKQIVKASCMKITEIFFKINLHHTAWNFKKVTQNFGRFNYIYFVEDQETWKGDNKNIKSIPKAWSILEYVG